jgi:type VI secretion system protein ImpH
METTVWQKQRAVSKLSQLAANAEFSQLVRLAKRVAKTYDLTMSYAVSPQLAFPVSDIADIALDKVGQTEKLTILVRFMGLIGASGSLPEHYTEYLLQRLQAKDSTLLAFLDLFHTQLLGLYYQTQNLSHFYIAEEEGKAHPLPQLLNAISGQAGTTEFDWQRYFSGLLGMQARSKKGLEQILQTYFQLPITVETYTPVWLRVEENDISRLSKANHNLSRTVMLGQRFTSVQDRFTLHISVKNYAEFEQCLPGSALLS